MGIVWIEWVEIKLKEHENRIARLESELKKETVR